MLFLLSIAAPVIDAVAARAATPENLIVELCTVDGVKHVALDRAGHPIDNDEPGHHAVHDCTGCPAVCGKHLKPIGLSLPAVPITGFWSRPASVEEPDVLALRPAACTPLPPRGPPILS